MNHYERLGISKDATKEQIRKAYYSKSKKTHPDKGGTKEAFQKVNEAYETLYDDKKRRQYDLTLAGGVRKTTANKTPKGTAARRTSAKRTSASSSRPTNNEGNTKMGFGKHFSRTYAWVERNDPGYIDWILRQSRVRNVASDRGINFNRFYNYCERKYGAAAEPPYTYSYYRGHQNYSGDFHDEYDHWDDYMYYPW